MVQNQVMSYTSGDFLLVVGHKNHAGQAIAGDSFHQSENLTAINGVESGARLVQDQ